MYRGTTPNIVFKVNSHIDLENLAQVWVTFKNKSAEKTYEIDDVEIDAVESKISVFMTQEDTLSFQTCGNVMGVVNTQIRLLDIDGYAYASDIKQITLMGVLKEGVIRNGD